MTRSSRKTAFIAVAALILVTVAAGLTWHRVARLRGRMAAEKDTAQGRLVMLTYGITAEETPVLSACLKRRYGIELSPMESSVVSTATVAYVDGYNQVSRTRAKSRYGADAFSICQAESLAGPQSKNRPAKR